MIATIIKMSADSGITLVGLCLDEIIKNDISDSLPEDLEERIERRYEVVTSTYDKMVLFTTRDFGHAVDILIRQVINPIFPVASCRDDAEWFKNILNVVEDIQDNMAHKWAIWFSVNGDVFEYVCNTFIREVRQSRSDSAVTRTAQYFFLATHNMSSIDLVGFKMHPWEGCIQDRTQLAFSILLFPTEKSV